MYLVQDTHNRFLKRNADNKITFTNSESLADVFPSEREANDYIRKTFGKKARKKYRAVRSENDSSPELIPFNHTMSEVSTEKYMCPPRKNRQKTQVKNRMKRMTNMVLSCCIVPHLFHGSLDNEPLKV